MKEIVTHEVDKFNTGVKNLFNRFSNKSIEESKTTTTATSPQKATTTTTTTTTLPGATTTTALDFETFEFEDVSPEAKNLFVDRRYNNNNINDNKNSSNNDNIDKYKYK